VTDQVFGRLVCLPVWEGIEGLQTWMSNSGLGWRRDGKRAVLVDVKLEKFVLETFLFEKVLFETFLFDDFSMFSSAGWSMQFAGHDESRCFRCRTVDRHSDNRSSADIWRRRHSDNWFSDIWRRHPMMRHWQRQSQAEYGEQGEEGGLRIIRETFKLKTTF
jgi:hypothetical protein